MQTLIDRLVAAHQRPEETIPQAKARIRHFVPDILLRTHGRRVAAAIQMGRPGHEATRATGFSTEDDPVRQGRFAHTGALAWKRAAAVLEEIDDRYRTRLQAEGCDTQLFLANADIARKHFGLPRTARW